MIVYHGSVVRVNKPDVGHSYRNLDFGQGFYVTTVKEQAERWAKRKADLMILTHGLISYVHAGTVFSILITEILYKYSVRQNLSYFADRHLHSIKSVMSE